MIGVAYYTSIKYLVDTSWLLNSPSQWPVIPICALSGLLGSIIDSLLGATVQFSGERHKIFFSDFTRLHRIIKSHFCQKGRKQYFIL